MNRPLALIEGSLAIPKPRPFDGLPPPFGSRRRTARVVAQDATQRASQPIAQIEAQRAMQDAVQRRPQQARPGPFPPGVKHLFFYKVPPQRVDSHRFDAALAEAKRYLEAGRARPRSSRSDHILGGAIFVGCSIALAWLLATCAMRDANKASELALKLPVVPAVSSPPIVETQEPIKLAQLAVEETQTIPRSAPSVGSAVAKAVVPNSVAAPLPASSAMRYASADLVPAPSTASQTGPIAAPASVAINGDKARVATPQSKRTQLSQRAVQQPTARASTREALIPSPAKTERKPAVARMTEVHVDERLALSRAVRSAAAPAVSKQPEWTARPSAKNDLVDQAALLNWTGQQSRAHVTARASVPTPLDNSWNDHMTQRRITDDPAAFHTDRGGK
jgi:hypothetical protein